MFAGFFVKYGKLLLEILVIAAIIFAVGIINPGNIFGGGLKLENTANNISAIKEIGQLITAEYYGEAIATYDQSKLKLIEEDDISDQANDIFRDMKQYLLEIHLEGIQENGINNEESEEKKKGFFSFKWLPWASKPKKKFRKELEKKDSLPLFYENPLSPEIMGFYFDKKTPESTENNPYKNMLWSLLQEVKAKSMELNQAAFNEYMLKNLPIKEGSIFTEFHYARKKKGLKKELRTDLAMIGRGWVKAGIDFGELNDQNFIYDKEHNIVHIYGVYPKILAKDINPWFIPEKKIPGFQILESRNANFEHAKEVKQYCIDKLEKMAKEAGILEQAERQSKETIKSFIGLLTDTEVKEVHFHNDTITRLTNEILKDKFVSFEEAKALDTIIPQEIEKIISIDTATENWLANQKNKELKETRLQNIIKELKSCYYLKRPNHYSRLSYLTTSIVADSILTEEEIKKIKKQKWPIDSLLSNKARTEQMLLYSSWYADSTLAFIEEYQDMLIKINANIHTVGKRVSDTLIGKSIKDIASNKEIDTLIKSKKVIDTLIINERTNDTLIYKLYIKPTDTIITSSSYEKTKKYRVIYDRMDKRKTFTDLKYPINIPKDWEEKFYKEKGYFERESISKKDSVQISVKELFEEINEYNDASNCISCESVQVTRTENGDWVIDNDACNITNQDKKATVQYILNYYLQESENFSWFSKSSKKTKKILKTESISKKYNNFKTWFSKEVTSF